VLFSASRECPYCGTYPNKIDVKPIDYTHAPCCLNCVYYNICGCGSFGDKGICLLYEEREE